MDKNNDDLNLFNNYDTNTSSTDFDYNNDNDNVDLENNDTLSSNYNINIADYHLKEETSLDEDNNDIITDDYNISDNINTSEGYQINKEKNYNSLRSNSFTENNDDDRMSDYSDDDDDYSDSYNQNSFDSYGQDTHQNNSDSYGRDLHQNYHNNDEQNRNNFSPDNFPRNNNMINDQMRHNNYQKMFNDNYYGQKKKGLKFSVILVTIIIVSSILLAAMSIYFGRDFLGLSGDETKKYIQITDSMSSKQIAELLKKEGIIDHTALFSIYSKSSSDKFVAGTHELTDSMSYSSIVEELSTKNDTHEETTVLFAEGFTLQQAAKALEDAGVCNAKEFIEAFNTTDNEQLDFDDGIKSDNKFYKMEGYCYPLTYTLYKNSQPKKVADVIKSAYNKNIYSQYYAEIKKQKYTLDEFMTLASIVQGEAPNKEEMERVASVFLNRLKNPDLYPRLETDTTNKYIDEVIKPNMNDTNKKAVESYDTYVIKGYPPGPINNPGEDAIRAVLYPAETDYYYFCSDTNSDAFFYAKTLTEHQANLKKAGLVN